MTITTCTPEETQRLAQALAIACSARGSDFSEAALINLEGELGGGKTTFVQGLARGLGVDIQVTSPTFILARRYPLSGSTFSDLHHFDFYRLAFEDGRELRTIGFKEVVGNPSNIVAVEWSDRLGRFRPAGLQVSFTLKGEQERQIKFKGFGLWQEIIQTIDHGSFES